jgi:hypothetical protein
MTFEEDLSRGYLENGEPLEALYGTGYWTQMPEPELEYHGGECPFCGEEAWYCNGEFLSCEKCGNDYKTERSESEDE